MVSLIVFACLWAPFLLPCMRTEAFLVSPAAPPPQKWATVAPSTPSSTRVSSHWRGEAFATRGRVKAARGGVFEYVGQGCMVMMCELCGDSTSGHGREDEAGPSLQPSTASLQPSTAHDDEDSERNSGGLLSPLEPPPSLTPSESPLSGPMINFIKGYKMFISPILPPACRFFPTCSEYAIDSIKQFGPAKGAVLTAWRLVRCNPTGGRGYDPPVWPPPPYNAGT